MAGNPYAAFVGSEDDTVPAAIALTNTPSKQNPYEQFVQPDTSTATSAPAAEALKQPFSNSPLKPPAGFPSWEAFDAAGKEYSAGQNASDFTAALANPQTGIVPVIGQGLQREGKMITGTLADIGTLPINTGQSKFRNLKAAVTDQPMPVEGEMKSEPSAVRALYSGTAGTLESAPRLAAFAADPVLGAAAFGTTPKGFDVKQAVMAAALPVVGKYGGAITEAIASKSGVTKDAALAALNKLGGASSAAGLIGADQARQIMKLPKEQQKDAWIDAVGNVGSMFILGGMGERSKLGQPKESEVSNAGKIESASGPVERPIRTSVGDQTRVQPENKEPAGTRQETPGQINEPAPQEQPVSPHHLQPALDVNGKTYVGDATHTDHDQILKSLPQEVRDEYTLLKNHDDAHVFVQTDENGKVISNPMNREASAKAIGFVNPNLKPGEAPYLNSEDLNVRKDATLKPGADPAQVLQSLKQIPKLKLTAGQKTLMDELESKSKANNSREAFARLQEIQDVGKPNGFKYDMTVKSKIGNSLQFTFSNLPKDDPAYGATFYVPEDATPEQIKTRAGQIAKEFREGKTPQYIREGLPKIERASSAPPKEPPTAGTAQKTATAAEPLGLNRPAIQNPSLGNLSDEQFDAEFRSAKSGVDAAEKGMDSAFDAGRELTPQQRKSIGAAQDRWTAVSLERFKRNTKDTVPEDLFYELKNLASNAAKFGPESEAHQKARIILDELKRQGATPEQMMAGLKLSSPDASEVFKADLEDIKKIITEIPAKSAKSASPVETLNTAKQVKVKAPEGATSIRATSEDGKTQVIPLQGKGNINQGDNTLRGTKWVKVEAGTGITREKFKPLTKGSDEVTVAAAQEARGGSVGAAAAGEVATHPQTGTTGAGADIYGVAARVRKARAAAGQVAPIGSGHGVAAEDAVKWGQELIRNGVDPEKSMQDFERNHATSFDLFAMARGYGEQLAKSARSIEDKFGTDSDEYRMAQKALSDWDARTKVMQTEWHKQGMAQQGETDIDTGSFTGINRAFRESIGRDLNPSEAKTATKIVDGIKKADAATEQPNLDLETGIEGISEKGVPVKVAPDLDGQRKAFQDYESGKPMTPLQVKTLWARAKAEYIDKGNDDKGDIVHKLGEDLGIPAKDVLRGLSQTKEVKRVADDLWQKQRQARLLKQSAKRWIEHSQETWIQKTLPATARTLFSLKVGLHGTVAMGTHASLVAATNPIKFAQNFGRMYKLVASPEYYEMQQAALSRRPNYTVAQRNGLVNDMSKMDDFNDPQLRQGYPRMTAWFKKGLDRVHLGRLQGMGTRGYSVLKILRQDLFDHEWDKLAESQKTPDMAKAISDSVNHMTGVTKAGAGTLGKAASYALFAPKLEASRVAVIAADPIRAFNNLSKLGNMTDAEKWFAKNQFKEKAKIFAVATGLMLANQQLNNFFGDKKKLNGVPTFLGGGGWNPMASDFMKFRVAGMNFAWGSPFLTMTRLPLRLYQIGAGSGGKTKYLIYPDESMYKTAGSYLRTQASPFLSPIISVITKGDYEDRPLPQIPGYGEPPPVPKRLAAQGIKPYTWPEFISDIALPIPIEQGANEIWHNQELAKTPKDNNALTKSLITVLVTAGTGGRLTEDWNPSQHPQSTVPDPFGK